jgi:hypothetical protein
MTNISMLHAQLRRMRAMDYGYHALFFRYINLWIGVITVLLMLSLLEPLRAAILLVPYLILYTAMQGAFHFHYVIFARHFARGLEDKLNQVGGRADFIANELEELYLMPLDAPRLVGFSLGALLSFFSVITLHYGIAGTLLWALSLYRAWQIIPLLAPGFPPLDVYLPMTLMWTVANMLYVFWYFVFQRDEHVVARRIDRFVKEGQP